MARMAGNEPGDRPRADPNRSERQLERPPGERYVRTTGAGGEGGGGGPAKATLYAPLAKSLIAAAIGALVLYALGALFSSSVGLVFVAGLTGAAVGLLLARAASPGEGRRPALTRRGVTRAAVAIALAAVVIGAVATWRHALGEGGALGLVDYLFETFGATVPLELVVAAVTALWGAGAGPVER